MSAKKDPPNLLRLLDAATKEVEQPVAFVVAGHNGSGKTTFWTERLSDVLEIPLINADRLTLSMLPEPDRKTLAFGVVLGLLGAGLAAFSFRAQLYGVSAADPIAYGAALLTVTLAVALAVWPPVRRATRVNPAEALRAD